MFWFGDNMLVFLAAMLTYHDVFAPSYNSFITRRLIFARAHWTKHLTWYKNGQRVSENIHRPAPRPILHPLRDFIKEYKTDEESRLFSSNHLIKS